jgi:hypothetical protein
MLSIAFERKLARAQVYVQSEIPLLWILCLGFTFYILEEVPRRMRGAGAPCSCSAPCPSERLPMLCLPVLERFAAENASRLQA